MSQPQQLINSNIDDKIIKDTDSDNKECECGGEYFKCKVCGDPYKCAYCGICNEECEKRAKWTPYYYDEVKREEDSEDEDEYEYENCGTQPDGSYMVAGGGMMNGNAYATVEKKDGKYYYCEYGPSPYRKYIGNAIIWSDERRDDGCGEFNIE